MTLRLFNFMFILLVAALLGSCSSSMAQDGSVTVTVQHAEPGIPVKFGLPFPKGALQSPDHVRVLNARGEEIASQKTEVTTWEPADTSIKWLWVFFFADESEEYTVEYGDSVRQSVFTENPIIFKNNQRESGFAEINTGTLHIRVNKRNESGFIDRVQFNSEMNGFDEEHTILTGIAGRGTFLDLLDDAGVDTSKAVVHQHFIEKGSGPMHAILRVEGEYEYEREGHENAPFVTYLHAYAGKSYVKILHTVTYTGKPDKSSPLYGRQHEDIGTQTEKLVDEEVRSRDPGLTQPNDRIRSMGFGLQYHLEENQQITTSLLDGDWWEEGEARLFEYSLGEGEKASLFQTGPDPKGIPPVANSGADTRIDEGFVARVSAGDVVTESEKSEGWISLTDGRRSISIGMRNMIVEYPNELAVNSARNLLHAYSWSPNEIPMGFERADTEPDGGMVGNFAQGLTKTTEMAISFHDGEADEAAIRTSLNLVLNPPVAHAGADWYSDSGVYGTFAGTDHNFQGLERSVEYKMKWMLFNRDWEPWYGTFDYGDVKNYFFNYEWYQWANNEPAQDFQWWFNFMRSGNPEYYDMARDASRHTMDVDNTHWPVPRDYRGDTNRSLDWFDHAAQDEIWPYVGMGRRHAGQQWISMLSAHVWVPGWIASYYLDGYHRGLDVAKLTGDYYVRRIFGGHGLTGRRLYLSIWNLAELYDATKDYDYGKELDDRVNIFLKLQREQGGRANIDRYGYSQNYISHGLSKYLQMRDRPDVERALVTHARSMYYNPPLDHDMESYLSSIHMLLVGYDLTGEENYLLEACSRSGHLVMDELPQPFESYSTQRDLADALEGASNLPGQGEGPSFRGGSPIWTFTGGLRIYGWTHAFNVAYTIDRLKQRANTSGLDCAVR
ncbi:hypothetical protein [Rhodohalobacter mucosus]|nr:hypothetical protein [Rhodohalobacter mucosus]